MATEGGEEEGDRNSNARSSLCTLEEQWSTTESNTLGELGEEFPGFLKRERSLRGFGASLPTTTSSRNSAMEALGHVSAPQLSVDSDLFAGLENLKEDGNVCGTEVTSCIHDAARITNWRTVSALAKSHPHCAKYTGLDRWTPLHHTCSRRCAIADVYASLITAYPDALLALDDKGWTPLHHACRFKAPYAAVRHLLHLYPNLGKQAATRRCNRGRTALYYAIRYDAPAGVVELLLEADPTAVLDEDRDGVSPLSIVWDKYASGIEGKRTLHSLLQHFEMESAGDTADDNQALDPQTLKEAETATREALGKSKKLKLKWDKANLLLRAAFHFPLQQHDDNNDNHKKHGTDISKKETHETKRKWRVLHATSAIKCHNTLFLLARALHPEQAFQTDDGDLYGFENDSSSNRTALHFAAASPACGKDGRAVIRSLLALNPHAAQVADNLDGSLPLHLISENERKVNWLHDGVRDIFQAFPDAAQAKDQLGQTPLHRAAANIVHGHPSPQMTEVGSIIQNLVIARPSTASIPDNAGLLPLHCIAQHFEGWDADAEAVLSAHKPAVRTRTGPEVQSRLPIHLAAASPDAMPDLVIRLVKEHPRGVAQADRDGKLPLHLACESGKSWDRGVSVIYDAYTPAISQPEGNKRGWTALHMAAASPNAGSSLINKLAELNPSAASTPDKMGRYPLHWACLTGKGWEKGGVKAIFEAAPSVAIVEDSRGFLPFHSAALALCEATKSSTLDSEESSSSPDEEQHSSSLEVEVTDAIMDGDDMETGRINNKVKTDTPETLRQINTIYQLLNLEPSVLIMK